MTGPVWIPGATRSSLGRGGDMFHDGPPRIIWHITWDALRKDGTRSITHRGLIESWFEKQPGRAPQVQVDPFTGQIHQYYPLDSAGKSVGIRRSPYYSPNRTGSFNMQVEVVFSPGQVVGGKRYLQLKDTPLKGIGELIRVGRQWGVPDIWPAGIPKASDTSTNRRVDLGFWKRRGGHYGHVHIPFNDHNDPLACGDLLLLAPRSSRPAPAPKAPAPAPPPPRRLPWQPVRFGARGGQVRRVQLALTGLGLRPGPADGIFGQQTLAAVREFQRQQKIAADGVAGPVTARRLGLV